jgi:fructoselysine 6-kinase
MPGFEVATVGDNCIDRYLALGLSTVGGNAVNVAVQLGRLGRSVGYFGRVGSDAAGERVLACLAENRVATDHVRVAEGQTAYTDIGAGPGGDRIMLFEDFGVCRGYRPDDADLAALRSMRHVHIGWLDDSGALKRVLTQAGVAVSQDLSVNADAKHIEAAGLAIAFASAASRDAGELLVSRILNDGARIAVVTCGAMGSIASDGTIRAEAGVVPAEVTDTLGAGDTFIAGCIAAHLDGGDLRACLQAGAAAAALTCTHYGGFPQRPLPVSAEPSSSGLHPMQRTPLP